MEKKKIFWKRFCKMKNKIDINLNKKLFSKYSKKNIIKIKKKYLDKDNYHLIVRNFETDSEKIYSKIIKFSKLFGKPLSQNKMGKKYVIIKPNVKLIKERSKNKNIKLRYHQTNSGGAIHSDGPQLSTPPKYVIMACIKQAERGGNSIISSAKKIYKFLKKNKPEILKILEKKFYFERRGFNFSKDNTFKKSIFEIDNKKFCFRYLREYIEAAYLTKKKKLSSKQILAFDCLDKLLAQKKFQEQYKLNKGDLIILNNNFLAHGRSGFKINSGSNQQRSFMRVWVR